MSNKALLFMIKIVRTLIFLLLTLSFLGALLSFSHPLMISGHDGTMSSCVSMGVMMCPMDPLEHLAAWQGAFAATTSGTTVLVLLLALVLTAAYSIRGAPHDSAYALSTTHFKEHPPAPFLSDPLARAFARGILHSKAF